MSSRHQKKEEANSLISEQYICRISSNLHFNYMTVRSSLHVQNSDHTDHAVLLEKTQVFI